MNRAPSDAENSNETSFNITAETHVWVETEDIRDQLGILSMVLTDQLNVMNDIKLIMARGHARVLEKAKTEDAPKPQRFETIRDKMQV